MGGYATWARRTLPTRVQAFGSDGNDGDRSSLRGGRACSPLLCQSVAGSFGHETYRTTACGYARRAGHGARGGPRDEMSIRPVEGEPWAEVRYTEYTGRAANAPKHNAWARAMSDVRLLRWLLPPKGRSVMAAPEAQGGGRAARDAHGPRRWADGASIKRGRCSPRPMLGR